MKAAAILLMLAILTGNARAKPCPDCGTENDDLAKFCKSGCGFEFQKAGDKVYVKGVADEAFDAGRWESAKRLYEHLLSLDQGNAWAERRKADCERELAEETRRQRERAAAERAAREKREYDAWVANEHRNQAFNLQTAQGLLEIDDYASAGKYALLALVGDWENVAARTILWEVFENGLPGEWVDVQKEFRGVPVAKKYRDELTENSAKVGADIVVGMAGNAEQRGDKKVAVALYALAVQYDPSNSAGREGLQRYSPQSGEDPDSRLRKRLRTIEPEVPKWVVEQEIEAFAKVRIQIREDGRIGTTELTMSSGHRELDNLAIGAVKEWLYEPGLVEYRVVRVNFKKR
ncbi:TonB family protein [Candidatus Fermentibacteria bacterium]|nr:TonB family protein [Candidatus Fermentibacteria bacterium]